jgi:hypothetical protein
VLYSTPYFCPLFIERSPCRADALFLKEAT